MLVSLKAMVVRIFITTILEKTDMERSYREMTHVLRHFDTMVIRVVYK